MSISVASFVLLYVIVSVCQASEQMNLTCVLDSQTYNPFFVRINLELYMLSMSNKSISIESTNEKFKPCKIIIDPLDDTIYGRMQATFWDGSQTIIVWGTRSAEVIDSDKVIYYTVLIVDPRSCSYKVVETPDDMLPITDQETPTSYPLVPPQIITYSNNRFDIFYPTQKTCSPCRYDEDGKRYRPYYRLPQLPYETDRPLHHFYIKPVITIDKTLGYFYVYNFQNNSAVMKYLDDSLEWNRRKFINHTVDVVSINQGNYRNLAICYRTHNSLPLPKDEHQEVHCERLNSKLQSGISVRPPIPEDHFVSNITLKVDARGNMFVGVIESGQIRVFIYDIDGQLVESLDFGSVDETKYSYHDLESDLVNNKYCLGVVEQVRFGVHEAHQVIKCFDIQKYTGQS